MQKNPSVALKDALQAVRNEKYKDGIHLKPKDLRDYFGTEIAAKTDETTDKPAGFQEESWWR
jgi:hypothetical protein